MVQSFLITSPPLYLDTLIMRDDIVNDFSKPDDKILGFFRDNSGISMSEF